MPQSNPESNTTHLKLEVGYIGAFEDGRPDKFGHFLMEKSDTSPNRVFREILKVEPSTRESTYIFSNIRQAHSFASYLDTLEFKKEEITLLIKKLVKPGIVKISWPG